MSNGVWVSSACVAMRKIRKPTNWVRMNGLPMPSKPKISPSAWARDDALQVEGAGLDDDADDGEHQRQLVGDELAGGPQAADERVLVGRRPAGDEDADHRERRHGQGEEDAGVEVRRIRRRARTGIDDVEQERRRRARRTAPGRRAAGRPRLGEDVLLLEELADLGEQLERAVGPGLHRAEPALHVAHHLEQEDVDEDARAGRSTASEHAEDLERSSAASRPSSMPKRAASPVDVPEDEVEAGEDRDDVGHVDAPEQPRHDRDVVERRPSGSCTRNGPEVALG